MDLFHILSANVVRLSDIVFFSASLQDTVSNRECCNIMCKCLGHEGIRGSLGKPGTKVAEIHTTFSCIMMFRRFVQVQLVGSTLMFQKALLHFKLFSSGG